MKALWGRWKEEPKFSFRVFLFGCAVFFAGALPLWLCAPLIWWLNFLCWSSLSLGVAIALFGYIGIWRWRWRAFLDK